MITDYSYPESRVFYYSSLSFLRKKEKQLSLSFITSLEQSVAKKQVECLGDRVRIFVRYLEWDSEYFACPTYRLEYTEWDNNISDPMTKLAEELLKFKSELSAKHGKFHLFTEVPSEDISVLQALGLAGFQLQETRLTHYIELESMLEKNTRPVRRASLKDITHLREVAMEARNDYDRYHADAFFSDDVADTYIAEYTEQCVRGLTDFVLVPDCDEMLPNAFICGAFDIDAVCKIRIGRLVLVAVGKARRGWYRDLNKALLMKMNAKGMSYCVNTTQSTNRAVIHVCEQLGYKYGRSTHIFSTK